MSEPKEKPVTIQQEIHAALTNTAHFTPQEQEEIAETIAAEVARLLPDLPDGIAGIVTRAMGVSLHIAGKIAGSPIRPADERAEE